MRNKITILVLLITTSIFLFSCQEEKPAEERKLSSIEEKVEIEPNQSKAEEVRANPNIYSISSTQFRNASMELGMVSMNNVDETITAAGYMEVPNENKAEVRSFIGGYLQSSPLLSGDYVKKNQFLISLENLEYIRLQQDYLQAKEKLTYLKTVYDRQIILAEEKITSQNNRQQAESDYNSALAYSEGLRKMLQLINVDPDKIKPESISSSINLYSPIDGYITKVNAVKGKFADPTDVIFEIINTNHLHVELKVYENDILKIKKGQKISFSIPEANSLSYSGEVFLVGKIIDEADRTVIVHCHITDDAKIPVVIGMYIEAEIYTDTQNKFCLPASAVMIEDEQYYVFINKSFNDKEYVFEKIRVEVGELNDDCVEIVGTSQQTLGGKQVLIEGAYDL